MFQFQAVELKDGAGQGWNFKQRVKVQLQPRTEGK